MTTTSFPGSQREYHPGSDRKSTRLNSSHDQISYAVFCLKKKKKRTKNQKTTTIWRHEHTHSQAWHAGPLYPNDIRAKTLRVKVLGELVTRISHTLITTN